jgi:hypothetical protein
MWFRGGNLNSFLQNLDTSCLRGMGPPHTVMTYIPSDATQYKKQEYKHPMRIQVRIDPPYPHVYRKRRLIGAVFWMRSRVTAGVA